MLSSDLTFAFNLMRWLGVAPYRGSDVAEMLAVAERITPGDFESWHSEFMELAQHVENEGRCDRRPSSITRRDRAFRAASYYRAADFFLHGTPNDPRIVTTWVAATRQFDRAIAELPVAGERLTIAADEFSVPAIFYRARSDGTPRPTILMFNGFDGSQEEMLHFCGLAALERGFNVLSFEGPGQPTVVREQNLGFRHDWECVVSPVVDFCDLKPEIDVSRLGLIGVSFGGYLAPRAVAFEPRIRAVVVIDGMYSGYQSVVNLLTNELKALLDADDEDAFNAAVRDAMQGNTGLRWFIEHGMWCYRAASPYDLYVKARPYTLEGYIDRITCPVLVCQAPDDHINPGQAEKLAEALGHRATFRSFTAADSAGGHTHPGASLLVNGVVYDWLSDTLDVDEDDAGGETHASRPLERQVR